MKANVRICLGSILLFGSKTKKIKDKLIQYDNKYNKYMKYQSQFINLSEQMYRYSL